MMKFFLVLKLLMEGKIRTEYSPLSSVSFINLRNVRSHHDPDPIVDKTIIIIAKYSAYVSVERRRDVPETTLVLVDVANVPSGQSQGCDELLGDTHTLTLWPLELQILEHEK